MITTLALVWQMFDTAMRRQSVVLFILMLIGSLLEGLGVGLIFPLLQVITTPESLHDSPWLGRIYAMSGAADASAFLTILCVAVLIAFVVKNIFFVFLTYYQQNFIWSKRAQMARMLFKHYLAQPYVFHLTRNSSVLMRNITITVQEVFAGVILPLTMLATELLVAAVIGLLLFIVDPMVSLIVIAVLGGVMGIFYSRIRHALARWGTETQDTNQRIIQSVNQALSGIKEIKAMGREGYFVAAFDAVMTRNSDCRKRYQVMSQMPRFLIEVAAIAVLVASMVLALSQNRPMAEMVPVLGLFAAAAFRLMPSLNRIAGQINNLRYGSAALEILRDDILACRTGSTEEAPPALLPQPFKRKITLEGISYRYPVSGEEVLSDIDLTIRCGESVALVGASGAGKSTLAILMMGLLEPTSGILRVDDVALSAKSFPAWRHRIAYISQDVFVTDDSLRRNIAFGQPDADINEARVAESMRRASLDDVVAMLPQGLDTLMGERGTRLSGGQRQRVGIARALYLDADVLVLDEATSALDANTESDITTAIRRLRGTKTLIIIAHRLSTVKHCDRIYFMERGRIDAQGTFAELAARNPTFRSMVDKMTLETGERPA